MKMYDREEDEAFKTTASNGTWDDRLPPLMKKLFDLYAPPVQSTVTHKKEEETQTTVTEVNSIGITVEKPAVNYTVTQEPGVEINIKEYSDNPSFRLKRIPTADFPVVQEKKRRMKVIRFEW